ncbi:replication-relaxation family protein [Dactylosporangium sp. NPDC051485]|uniref:replication-relaxation family protein n=1 Tax=Dactylosporangium sp. NPDC051485 TaxID=3154846 RepID=UPI0034360262
MRNPRNPQQPKGRPLDPLTRLRNHINDRDLLILSWLYDHHALTSAQIAHALFPSLDYAQRRLRLLTELQAISRFRPNKLDGGSYPYHYLLDQLGFVYILGERDEGLPRRDEARRRKQSVMTRPDLRHLLGGNQFFIDLAGQARTTPGAALETWRPAAAFHTPINLLRPGDSMAMAATKGVRLPRPDGAGVWRQDGRAVPFWVEYDTGTERLEVLAEKVFKYATLARAAVWAWPALFLLPSQRREDNLHHEMATYLRPPNALWFTANTEHLTASGLGPAGRVWRAGGPLRPLGVLPLIDLPYLDPEHDQRHHVANPRPWTAKPGIEPDED